MNEYRHISPARWSVLTCRLDSVLGSLYPRLRILHIRDTFFFLLFLTENMNYANGFPRSSKVQTDFIGHSTPSSWNTPASMPAAWGHASLVNSPVSVAPPVLLHYFLFLCCSLQQRVQVRQSRWDLYTRVAATF